MQPWEEVKEEGREEGLLPLRRWDMVPARHSCIMWKHRRLWKAGAIVQIGDPRGQCSKDLVIRLCSTVRIVVLSLWVCYLHYLMIYN